MSAKYYKDIGWFITSLNNVTGDYANDQTFWSIINTYGKASHLGMSIYREMSIYSGTFVFRTEC